MQEEREDGKHEEPHPKRIKIRSKKISTDFMRVEDIGTMPAMAPFELEIRKKIAERSKTPLDGLIAAEEKKERVMDLKRGNRTLNVLVKDGALTPRQALVYGLCYGKRLQESEVASLLGISPRTVQRLRQNAREAFVRGLAERRRGMLYLKKAAFHRLTRKQKKILKLRYREGLSVREIAGMFGRTERSVQRVLSRTLKKIFSV
ncbi:MAG: sigma factor-like helix-turn-helix DNA-binding protein [Candidatus Omnitrophota bacterium]